MLTSCLPHPHPLEFTKYLDSKSFPPSPPPETVRGDYAVYPKVTVSFDEVMGLSRFMYSRLLHSNLSFEEGNISHQKLSGIHEISRRKLSRALLGILKIDLVALFQKVKKSILGVVNMIL